ncbi:MAG: hypothetical protein E6K52_15000 [Gammaproteobacteria bacterium]|nr:MAG: hypothetical protein E6K52_15000 [Gammaproteobacteria bacterium]
MSIVSSYYNQNLVGGQNGVSGSTQTLPDPVGQGEVFQVDATGYGGNQNSVAVVESTVAVKPGVVDRGAL